jgi:hypothetical protein
MKNLILFLGCFLATTVAHAQLEEGVFKPVVALQTWGVYTINAQQFDDDLQSYVGLADRPGFMLRRSRLGGSFRANDQVKVKVVAAIDQVGHQPLDGTVGGTNNGSFPRVGLWNAWVDWQLLEGSDKLHLIGGYYTPMVSRESVTSAFDVASMEKAFSQWYIRKHLTGKGPGRTAGLTLAGLVPGPFDQSLLKYGVGVHNPKILDEEDASVALFTGRISAYIGDVEDIGFKLADPANDFTDRRLFTIGASGGWQATADGTRTSWTTGGDFSLRYSHVCLEGEWYWLGDAHQDEFVAMESGTQTGFLRMSTLHRVGEQYWLEPSVMWMFFRGAMDGNAQIVAQELDSYSGAENTFDAGLNFYFKQRKLKLYVHYTWRTGDPGDAGDGAMVNMYFVQSEVGAIRRGNWLGVGLNVVL